jgi:hypothetical protein
VLNRWQHELLTDYFKDRKPDVDDWLNAHFDIVDPTEGEPLADVLGRINASLRDAAQERLATLAKFAPRARRSGKTWLGSQSHYGTIDEHFRVPEVLKVPDVRDIRYSYGPVHFNRQVRISNWDAGSAHWSRIEESTPLQQQERLQLPSICRRTASCGMA